MREINSGISLKNTILQLEREQMDAKHQLKEKFHLIFESIKPINLIKNTFKDVVESEDLTDNILTTSTGLAAGYASKVLFERVSHAPLKKFLGTALMFGITNLVEKNPKVVRALGRGVSNIVSRIWKKRFAKKV